MHSTPNSSRPIGLRLLDRYDTTCTFAVRSRKRNMCKRSFAKPSKRSRPNKSRLKGCVLRSRSKIEITQQRVLLQLAHRK